MSLYLRLILLADRFGQDQARQNVLFIKEYGLRLRWSHTTKSCDFVGLIQQSRGTYIYRRVVRIFANSDMPRSSQFIKMAIFLCEKTKWKENPSILEDFSLQKDIRSEIHTSIDVWW